MLAASALRRPAEDFGSAIAPTSPVALDLTNPLARGLVFASLLASPTQRLQNLAFVGDAITVSSGTPRSGNGARGSALYYDGASYHRAPTGNLPTGDFSVSVLVRSDVASTGPSNPIGILAWGAVANGQMVEIGIGTCNNSTGGQQDNCFYGTSYGSSLGTAGNEGGDGKVHHFVATRASSTWSVYRDGVFIYSDGTHLPAGTVQGSNLLIGTALYGTPMTGLVELPLIWNRCLGADEVAWLASAPFSLLRPAVPNPRRVFFSIVTATASVPFGGAVVVGAAQQQQSAAGTGAFGALAVAASAGQQVSATGAVLAGPLAAPATAAQNVTAAASIAFLGLAATGAGSQTVAAAGSAIAGPLVTAGAATQITTASGIAAFGPLLGLGTALQGNSAAGAIVLAGVGATGSASQSVSAAGGVFVAPLAATALAVQTLAAIGAAQAGPLRSTGAASQGLSATGVASFGAAQAAGLAQQGAGAVASILAGPLLASGVAQQSVQAAGGAVIALLTGTGLVVAGVTAGGTATFGGFAAGGTGNLALRATGTLLLPSLVSTGTAAPGLTFLAPAGPGSTIAGAILISTIAAAPLSNTIQATSLWATIMAGMTSSPPLTPICGGNTRRFTFDFTAWYASVQGASIQLVSKPPGFSFGPPSNLAGRVTAEATAPAVTAPTPYLLGCIASDGTADAQTLQDVIMVLP